jgi:hypothetical protein
MNRLASFLDWFIIHLDDSDLLAGRALVAGSFLSPLFQLLYQASIFVFVPVLFCSICLLFALRKQWLGSTGIALIGTVISAIALIWFHQKFMWQFPEKTPFEALCYVRISSMTLHNSPLFTPSLPVEISQEFSFPAFVWPSVYGLRPIYAIPFIASIAAYETVVFLSFSSRSYGNFAKFREVS